MLDGVDDARFHAGLLRLFLWRQDFRSRSIRGARINRKSTMSSTLRFRSRIEINGINPYVPVSAARAAKLKGGWRKPMPVLVRVNGKPDTPWRINMMPAGGGGFYLYLHGTVREQSGTGVGDTVRVEVSFEESYRGGPATRPPGSSGHCSKMRRRAAAGKRSPQAGKRKSCAIWRI